MNAIHIYSTTVKYHETVGFAVCCVPSALVACDSLWACKESIPLCPIRPIPLCLMRRGAESRWGWLPPPTDLLLHTPLLSSCCGRGCLLMCSLSWCWFWRSSGKVIVILRAAPDLLSPLSALISLISALSYSHLPPFEVFFFHLRRITLD